MRTAAPALVALALLTSACGGSSSPAASRAASSADPSGSITVFAAASLTGAFTELGQQFEQANPGTKVTFSFGASSTLAQQVIAGAPADVFASASPKNMAQVTDARDAINARTFATNVAEVAVAPASKAKVTALADLAKPGIKVALCQPQVPCGALAQTVLDKAKVSVQPVTQGLDVKSTLAYVTSGEADAAIVYATDVRAAGDSVVGVEVPAAQNASTAYPIATVKSSKNAALAAAFEDFVLSSAGQSVLGTAGFSAP
ncbi:molybdate transport system substrate-binding protein [Motilibacter peucedani]|uniref:Molybdate transport system substrate-binding protein n=1 Tax=Motilibacter peucedani TaxID=598650 RepID=A0A420XUL8_9ACTN|nr:molybdate ABC transporter substrate-binding protein [Motilibacter peucedani]RKS80440.1 molybdate transport system substrate-binding protein [Motilibacter peucedani]